MFKIEIAHRNYSVRTLKNKSLIVALCQIFFILHFENSLGFFSYSTGKTILTLLYNNETVKLKNKEVSSLNFSAFTKYLFWASLWQRVDENDTT